MLKVVSSSTPSWWCLGCPWFGLAEGGGAAPPFGGSSSSLVGSLWSVVVCVSHLSVVVFVSLCLLVLLLVSSSVCFGCCVVVCLCCSICLFIVLCLCFRCCVLSRV